MSRDLGRWPFPRPVPVFVGCETLVARALAAMEAPGLTILYGPPGVGKSELVYRAVEQARAEGRGWARAAIELSPPRPGAELSAALARALDCALDGPLKDDYQADHILAAMSSFPGLIFIDDFTDWAAPSAGAALAHWARRARGSRICVASAVGGAVPDGGAASAVLRVDGLTRSLACELAQQVARQYGTAPPDLERVWDQSGGNPALVRQVVVGGGGEGAAEPRAIASLAARSASARALLELLVAFGRPVSLDDLAEALDLSREDAEAAIDELSAHFFVERGEAAGAGLAATAFAAAVAPSSATPEAMARARSRAAALRQRRFEDDPVGRAADAIDALRDLLEGGQVDAAWRLIERERERIPAGGVDYALLSILEEIRERLPEQRGAVDALRVEIMLRTSRVRDARALLAGDRCDPAQLVWRARCAVRMGEFDAAQADLAAAAELSAPALDLLLARCEVDSATGAAGRAVFALRAQLDARPHTDHERARLWAAEAFAHFVAGDWDRAERGARQSLALLGQPSTGMWGEDPAAVHALACLERDRLAPAVALANRLEASAADPTQRSPLLSLLLGATRYCAGDLAVARGLLAAAQRLASEQRDLAVACLAGEYLGRCLIELGEIPYGVDVLRRAAADALAVPWLAGRMRARAAAALIDAGKLEAARRELSELVACDPEVAGDSARRTAIAALALAHGLSGDLPGGRQVLDAYSFGRSNRAHSGDAQGGDRQPAEDPKNDDDSAEPDRAAIDLARAELELLGGDSNVARECARRARRHYGRVGWRWREASASLALAAAYLSQPGDAALVGATRELARIKPLLETSGWQPLQQRFAVMEASAAARRGDAPGARQILIAALQRARTVGGEQLDVQLVRCALEPGTAGARTAPGLRSLVAGLGLAEPPAWELVDRRGRRALNRLDVERERAQRELTVDVRSSTLSTRSAAPARSRPIVCGLLARLIAAGGEGVDAETLYRDVWQAGEYHPLRHRNTLHVTLNHARRALEALMPGRSVIERSPAGWRIAPDVDACAVLARSDARESL